MKYALFILLFVCACTTSEMQKDKVKATLNYAINYNGIFTNIYGLDMEFKNTNLPYWWSENFIDSLDIQRIEIKEFKGEDFDKGIDYGQALPRKQISFKFNTNGALRSMHKLEYYDDILISSKEYRLGKPDACGRVEAKQKVFSKFKKKHFYDPSLENTTEAFLEPLENYDSVYVYKGRKSEVLCLNTPDGKKNYLRDSLNKAVYDVQGSLKNPKMMCCYRKDTQDTLEQNVYSNTNVLLFNQSNEGEVEHRKYFTYANNTLVEIKDSLFIEQDFVSEESYLFFYDSLGLPSQIQRKETLENSVSQLNAVYILTFNE